MTDEAIKEQIKDIVKRSLGGTNYKIFVFGSRATGENRQWSDIDLGILSEGKIPGHVMIKIEEELENSQIPYKIDLVDFRNVSDQFRKIALKRVVYL